MHIDELARRNQAFEQLGGGGQVPQAQGGEKRFAKCSDIQHTPTAVQPIHRFQRPAAESVLTIVIVLDYPGLFFSGPVQQRQAPGQAHGHADRELVGGGDDGQPCIATESPPHRDVDALTIDRHRHYSCSGGKQRSACSEVSGILDPCALTRVEQHACDQIEGALRTGGQDDLFGRAMDASRDPDVRGDCLAQRGVALWVSDRVRRLAVTGEHVVPPAWPSCRTGSARHPAGRRGKRSFRGFPGRRPVLLEAAR